MPEGSSGTAALGPQWVAYCLFALITRTGSSCQAGRRAAARSLARSRSVGSPPNGRHLEEDRSRGGQTRRATGDQVTAPRIVAEALPPRDRARCTRSTVNCGGEAAIRGATTVASTLRRLPCSLRPTSEGGREALRTLGRYWLCIDTPGEPCHRQRIIRPSSYHPTPRVKTPGVGHFYVPLCDFSHPSAVNLGLFMAPQESRQTGPQKPSLT
jgi:hypothetical protein